MFSRKLALSLCSSIFLFFSYSYSASGSLLTDPDGLNISLYNDGSASNAFGPDSYTIGYDPALDMNPTPGVLADGSEMLVSFFANSISFSQKLVSSGSITTSGWTMLIDDIDWPDAGQIVSANISSSSYQIALSVDYTANSVTIRYDGDELLTQNVDFWEATVTFETAMVPVPPMLGLLFLGFLGLCFTRNTD